MYNILEPCPKFVGAAAIDERLGGQGEVLAGVVNEFYAAVTERLYKQAESLAKTIQALNKNLNKALKRQDTLLRTVTEHYRKQVSVRLAENYAKLTHVAQQVETAAGKTPAFVAPGAVDFTVPATTVGEPESEAQAEVSAPPLTAPKPVQIETESPPPCKGSLSAAVELRRCLEAAQAVMSYAEIAAVIEAAGGGGVPAQIGDKSGGSTFWDYLLGRRPIVEILPSSRPGVIVDILPGLEAAHQAAAAAAPPIGPVSPSLRAAPAACDAPSFALITLGSY